MASNIPGITLSIKPRYSFQTIVKCHVTTFKMSAVKEKREKKRMTSVGKDVEKLENLFIVCRSLK